MVYINTLPTRIHNSTKFPVHVEGEAYFYRHPNVKFTLSITAPLATVPHTKHSATGRIFMTDKRLIFIADTPSPDDGFETFSLVLSDVISSRLDSSGSLLSAKYTFSIVVTLETLAVLGVSVTFSRKDTKAKAKQTLEDYYTMIIETVTATRRKDRQGAQRITLENVTAMGMEGIGEPPIYRRDISEGEALFGFSLRDEELPPYSGSA